MIPESVGETTLLGVEPAAVGARRDLDRCGVVTAADRAGVSPGPNDVPENTAAVTAAAALLGSS
ncbi:hypothetical protein BG452_38055 [Streptomyces sp. CBMA123]|nr:hypothetical protein [Streptomyces sp. CBMA123]